MFSNDGQRLASGSSDKSVKVWGATSGICLQTLSVGQAIYRCSFDTRDETRPFTNIAVLNLNVTTSETISSSIQDSLPHYGFDGYGIGENGVWIMKGMERILWLPPEYRPLQSAVVGSTAVLGCRSGRVLIIGFRDTDHRDGAMM